MASLPSIADDEAPQSIDEAEADEAAWFDRYEGAHSLPDRGGVMTDADLAAAGLAGG
jgi:hypothetical protein